MTTPPLVALERLMAGNRRFVAGQLRHPHGDARHREHVAEAQHPIAIVVCCSDSREVPELIFDCGLGDLFVVRTAGHCVGETALASVEFGAMVLGVELVVVLGHTKCGAVAATLSARHELDAPAGHIPALLHMIRPAMDEALLSTPEHDLPESVMRIHVRRTAAALADISSKPLVVGGALRPGHRGREDSELAPRGVPRNGVIGETQEMAMVPTQASVSTFLSGLASPVRRHDSLALVSLMGSVSGEPAVMWGTSIIGFGQVHYRYDSGTEGDRPAMSFAPRASQLVLYGLAADVAAEPLMDRLGTYTVGKGCLNIKKLQDVDLEVLRAILERAWRENTSGNEPH